MTDKNKSYQRKCIINWGKHKELMKAMNLVLDANALFLCILAHVNFRTLVIFILFGSGMNRSNECDGSMLPYKCTTICTQTTFSYTLSKS